MATARSLTDSASPRTTLRNKGIRRRRLVGRVLVYCALVTMSVVYFLPIWWMLITSFKTLKETYSFPPTFFPRTFTMEGYANAWEYMNWPRHFANTMLIVVGTLAGIVMTFDMLAGNPTNGLAGELDAIAAVVIGGTLLTGGIGYVTGTLLGVLIFGIIGAALVFEGSLSSSFQRIAIGLLLLAFILLQRVLASGIIQRRR